MEITGVLLAIIAGVANGSYPAPKNYFKEWQDCHVWSAFALFSFFLIPLSVLLDNLSLLNVLSISAITILIVAGLLFSLGMACFTLSLRKIGLAPSFSLNIIFGTSLGTLTPLFLFHANQLFLPSSLFIYGGVLLFISGIFFLYFSMSSENSTTQKKDKVIGVFLGILSGILTSAQSSAYNYAINELNAKHLSQIFNELTVWSIFFISSFPIFFLIHLVQSKNKTSAFTQFKTRNFLLVITMATLYYLSIALFSYSTNYVSVPVAWSIFMTSIVLTTNFWSTKLNELTKVRKKYYALYIAMILIAFLFFAFSMNLGES